MVHSSLYGTEQDIWNAKQIAQMFYNKTLNSNNKIFFTFSLMLSNRFNFNLKLSYVFQCC